MKPRCLCLGRQRIRTLSLLCFCWLLGLLFPVHSFVQTLLPRTTRAPSLTTLAGIKGFRAFFQSQFPDAIQEMPKSEAHEEFDHVLIDMNQLLHISLRRSRSEGHALTILMKELDACCALATPRISLVLAMDGPPSAAKLATQRRRRFSTFVRSEWKQEQLARFKKFSKQDEARRRRKYATETKTLCITPGTAFMEKAEKALLYWAWQRMQNYKNPLSKVRVYISSSNVHGEGEVKLLDWILKHNRHGQSIAIMGGDSDLVLEGLVIPPSSSHNVFVLLPDGNKKYFCVSLWETTRALAKFLPKLNASDIMRVRTDMVLLLILNGNDYLPKLRGSSGFNKVFHTYLRLLHRWLDDKDAHPQDPFLVDPDSLEFNLPFCVAFFRQLAHLAPLKFFNGTYAQQPMPMSRVTPLGRLNDLVDSGLVSAPIQWSLVSSDDEDAEVLPMNDQVEEDVSKGASDDDEEKEQHLMRLTLGKPGTDDFCEYELWHDVETAIKKTKHRLALMALDDLMGTEYFSELDESDEEAEDDVSYPGITSSGYSWEVQYAAPGRVDKYLAGLLWNLQTYQDGICADYAYNYGRRMSPTATEIVDFFKDAMKENRTVGRDELLGETFSPATSAGISCLAALPSQVQELIPEPYNRLSNTTVEEMYAACMDPEDNCFDMKQFERFCDEHINATSREQVPVMEVDPIVMDVEKFGRHGRRILTGDHYWVVLARQNSPLAHPFDPPPPFSSRLSELRPNRRLRVSRTMATAEPRPRTIWSKDTRQDTETSRDKKEHIVSHKSQEVKHADLGDLLKAPDGRDLSILDVEYDRAFPEFKAKGKKKRRKKFELKPINSDETAVNGVRKTKKAKRRDFDEAARMREFNLELPPPEHLTNVEGFPPMVILNQLSDARMIGKVDFSYETPSPTSYASVDPLSHEHVQLVVRKGTDKATSILFEDLTYEQDRDINKVSRKSLKHHLGSFALCDILGPRKRWSEMTFKEMKTYLKRRKRRNGSKDGQDTVVDKNLGSVTQ